MAYHEYDSEAMGVDLMEGRADEDKAEDEDSDEVDSDDFEEKENE